MALSVDGTRTTVTRRHVPNGGTYSSFTSFSPGSTGSGPGPERNCHGAGGRVRVIAATRRDRTARYRDRRDGDWQLELEGRSDSETRLASGNLNLTGRGTYLHDSD